MPASLPSIRAAEDRDLDRLVLLLKTLFAIEEDFRFDENLQRRGLAMMLGNRRACVLVAEAEEGVIGMCTGQVTVSTAEGGPALLVEDVVVLPHWQRRDVGRSLMTAMTDWARARGISRLQLLADATNENALAFYHRLGWQRTQLICLRNVLGG